jgi:hypothetical protein
MLDSLGAKEGACAAGGTPLPRIRQPAGHGRRMIARLAGAWGLDKTTTTSVRAMFSPNTTYRLVHDPVDKEVCFSFWGFVPSDDARWKLLEFFCWSMHPRMYMTGQTRSGSMEAVMVVRVDMIHIGREQFETWLETFLSSLRMSAGVHVFTRYLDEPMVACMQRIQGSTKFRGNLFTEWNKDLRILYGALTRERSVQASIMAITGMHFTTENFVSLWEQSQRTARISQILQSSVGREVPAQITAAGAGTTVHAEATRSRPWSDLQIAAFGGVGVLTRTTDLEHPRGTWRINRSA